MAKPRDAYVLIRGDFQKRGAKVERLDRPAMGHEIDRESIAAAVAFLTRNLAH